MITVEGLTKTYGGFKAVDNVSFESRPGAVTGFLGPNGAGKSTTMRIMAGLTPATSGEARVGGVLYHDIPNPGTQVGVLLDASAQHAGRTGREILTLSALTMGLPMSRVDEMLKLVSLTPEESKRRVKNYSLGMRQRLGIANALAGRPQDPDPRRAGQRPRPGGHPLDAQPASGVRQPWRHRAAVVAPAARDRGHRRRDHRHRQRQDRGAGHQGGAPADGRHVRQGRRHVGARERADHRRHQRIALGRRRTAHGVHVRSRSARPRHPRALP